MSERTYPPYHDIRKAVRALESKAVRLRATARDESDTAAADLYAQEADSVQQAADNIRAWLGDSE